MSIAKAGIICTLNARTAILAAANPIDSKYNPKHSVVENIRLPPTLMSRFDLIYLMLDKQSEAMDRRLANHIVSLYGADDGFLVLERQGVSREFLAEYITFARKYVFPRMKEDVADALVESYQSMRRIGNSQKTISATPRQLESLIRLAEANARMRLSTRVAPKDVEEASRLVREATQ